MIKSVQKVLQYSGRNPQYKYGKDIVLQAGWDIVEYRYSSEHSWCICVQNRQRGVFAVAAEGNRGAKNREDIYRAVSLRRGLKEVGINEVERI